MSTYHVSRTPGSATRGLTDSGVKQVLMGYRGRKLAAVDPDWKPQPGMLYTQVRAISARINQNFDAWPSEELKKSYRTFLGKPVFINHNNDDPSRARGKVIAARYVEAGDDKYIEVIQEIDAERFPKLAKEIREGGLDSVSMGVEAGLTKCSYCGNKATDEPEFCEHVKYHKGDRLPRKNTKTGKTEDVLVFEHCYKLGFFELSMVFDPADETAVVSRVIAAGKQNRREAYEAWDSYDPDYKPKKPGKIRRKLREIFDPDEILDDLEQASRLRDFRDDYQKHKELVHVGSRRRHGYGEVTAPADIDTLRDEDGDTYDDYQFVEPLNEEDTEADEPFQHWIDSPEELRQPDLGQTKRLDREQEDEGLDTDRRVEDVEDIMSDDEADMAQLQGRQAMARTRKKTLRRAMEDPRVSPETYEYLKSKHDSGNFAQLGGSVEEVIDYLLKQQEGFKDDPRYYDKSHPDEMVRGWKAAEEYENSPDYRDITDSIADSKMARRRRQAGYDDLIEDFDDYSSPVGPRSRVDRPIPDYDKLDREDAEKRALMKQDLEEKGYVQDQWGAWGRPTASRVRHAASDEEMIEEALLALEEAHEDAHDHHPEPDGDEDEYGEEPEDEEYEEEPEDEEYEEEEEEEYPEEMLFVATVGRKASAGNRRGKGNSMGSLSGRGRVATRGRQRHYADTSGHVDGGPYGNDADQGNLEEVYISQVPAAEPVDMPSDDESNISNTEQTLVANRLQREIKARAADLQRYLTAYRRVANEPDPIDPMIPDANQYSNDPMGSANVSQIAENHGLQQLGRRYEALCRQAGVRPTRDGFRRFYAECDNITEPSEVNPPLSGTDEQDLKGDFESVQPEDVHTQPKDASVRVFRAFDNWLRSTTGRTARQHGNANYIRRQAASYSKASGISLEKMFPALDVVLRQTRKAERSAPMNRRRAEFDGETVAPDARIDVEAPVQNVTDADAQASQYNLGDYGNNAGDDIANPNTETDSQIWAPKEGNRKADGVAAVRYAEAYINAGLPCEDKWKLVAQAQTIRHATVVDRTRLLEYVAQTNATRARTQKVAAAVSRGTTNGIPKGLTAPRPTQRTAANDPADDFGLWF